MIKLGEHTFEVPVPKAMESFAFQQSVLPVAGRVVGALFHFLGMAPGSDVNKLMAQDVTAVLPQALPVLGEVFASMPPGELDKITRKLLGSATATMPDGKTKIALFGNPAGDPFDALMAGRTADTWQLLWHALEVWYPDFFTRGRALFASAKKENQSPASTT